MGDSPRKERERLAFYARIEAGGSTGGNSARDLQAGHPANPTRGRRGRVTTA